MVSRVTGLNIAKTHSHGLLDLHEKLGVGLLLVGPAKIKITIIADRVKVCRALSGSIGHVYQGKHSGAVHWLHVCIVRAGRAAALCYSILRLSSPRRKTAIDTNVIKWS